MSAAASLGLLASLASIAFISLGQLWARASDEAARAAAAMMSFMQSPMSNVRQKMLTVNANNYRPVAASV